MNYLAGLLAPFVMFGAYIGSVIAPEPELGASEAIPTTIAFFETTLASAITDSATSFTLTSATDKDGTVLASSTYAFVIDEGSSNEEIVIADCTGTTCTNALRGVSARTGNTEVAALKKTHRRGASVKITDAPILMLVSRILRGEQGVDFTPDTDYDLVTKTYVDSLALGSTTISASLTDDGIVELATGVEAASSTATGGSGSPLVLHTGISTSTAPSSGSYVVVTGADGDISDGFVSSSSVTQYAIWRASTTVFAATTTAHSATSTWTKPTGLKFIVLEMVGGGGGGAGFNNDTPTAGGSGGGGGSGAYCKKIISASSLATSEQIVAGNGGVAGDSAGGTGGNGGYSKFGSFATTTGGTGGQEYGSGAGGSITGSCDISIVGATGGKGAGAGGPGAGNGASSILGIGGLSLTQAAGAAGVGYGAGGGGGTTGVGQSEDFAGGAGAYGAVIITEYF